MWLKSSRPLTASAAASLSSVNSMRPRACGAKSPCRGVPTHKRYMDRTTPTGWIVRLPPACSMVSWSVLRPVFFSSSLSFFSVSLMDSIRFLRIRIMELIVAKIPTQAGIRRSLAVERIAMVVPIEVVPSSRLTAVESWLTVAVAARTAQRLHPSVTPIRGTSNGTDRPISVRDTRRLDRLHAVNFDGD
jgi:hypothetical protein